MSCKYFYSAAMAALLLFVACNFPEGFTGKGREARKPAAPAGKAQPRNVTLPGMASGDSKELYNYIAEAAKQAGADLEEVRPAETKSDNRIVYFIRASGPFFKLVTFVAEMSKGGVIWRVDDLQVHSGPAELSVYHLSAKWSAFKYLKVPDDKIETEMEAKAYRDEIKSKSQQVAEVLDDIFKGSLNDIELMALDMKAAEGTLTGRAKEHTAITRFIGDLEQSPRFSEVSFSGVHEVKADIDERNQEFRVTFKIR